MHKNQAHPLQSIHMQYPAQPNPGAGPGMDDFKEAISQRTRPRAVMSGLRYTNIEEQADELDIAEEMLKCVRLLPKMCKNEKEVTDMAVYHEKMINDISDAVDLSLQPCLDIVLNDKNVVNAIFDLENRYDQIEFIFNVAFALLRFVEDNEFKQDVNRLCQILSSQSDEFSQINIKLYVLCQKKSPANKERLLSFWCIMVQGFCLFLFFYFFFIFFFFH